VKTVATKKPTYEELEQTIKDLEKVLDRQREEQRENETRVRAIFDQTYEFIGLMTPDGVLIEANRTALSFAGVKSSDVIGKPFWETPWWTHSKESQQRLRDAVRSAAGGEFVRFEATHRAADATLRYIDFSLKPVKNMAGKIVLLIPEGRDITDRKHAEQALRESENLAHSLLNAPVDPVLLLDREGVVLDANPAAALSIGRHVNEIVRKSIFGFLSKSVAEWRRIPFDQAVESGKPVRFEDQHRGKFWDHSLYPILNSEGKVAQIAVYIREVTDFRQAVIRLEERTAELLASEKKYRTLVENIPVVVYGMTPEGQILFVNRVVEAILGYSPDDILADPSIWYEKVYDKDRPRVEALRKRSFEEGKEFIAEYRIRHKSGYIVYVRDHAIPVRLANGLTGSVDGFIMDVTGTVRLQEKLLGEAEIKTISEVSARLAHEMRNPLVSAGGFARRLLSSMSPGDPNRTKVEIIVEETSRMETILRMILSYIQPLDLHLSRIDPNSLVTRVLSNLDAQIQDRKAHIDLQLASGAPQIFVDRERAERVLDVLLRNGLLQMPEGGRLSLSTFMKGRIFNLVIRYPVTSVSPDDVEHFFYPFTSNKMISETVDLPLSKIIIDKLGGTINVDLERPQELTVHVSLPF
jgi:PAS domain S-box-containing protein